MAKNTKNEEEKKIDLEDIKQELKDYVDIKIKNGFTEELEKSNRRLIREKNKKIIFRNFIIIVLLVIIGLLIYLLYSNKYFHKLFNDSSDKTIVIENKESKEEVKEEKKLTLEELINKYSYLLDSIVISEKCDYIEDYYKGNLTNELKHYIVLNNIDFDKLSKEDDYNIIDLSLVEKEYEKIFNGKYEAASFKYDSNKIRYINKMQSFVSDKLLEKVESNISRQIIDIKEEDDKVIITCIEGIFDDNKLYNITSSKEVCKKDCKLKENEDDLNKISYTFVNGKLESIKKM